MKDFVMLFRNAPTGDARPTPEVMQEFAKKWDTWLAGISGQGKFVSGSRLGFDGKILKPGNVVTDGPYAEVKEILGGFINVKAASLDEALRWPTAALSCCWAVMLRSGRLFPLVINISKKISCPILTGPFVITA